MVIWREGCKLPISLHLSEYMAGKCPHGPYSTSLHIKALILFLFLTPHKSQNARTYTLLCSLLQSAPLSRFVFHHRTIFPQLQRNLIEQFQHSLRQRLSLIKFGEIVVIPLFILPPSFSISLLFSCNLGFRIPRFPCQVFSKGAYSLSTCL